MSRYLLRVLVWGSVELLSMGLGATNLHAGTVQGTAVDLKGAPLPNITASVTGGNVSVTNAQGVFVIPTPNVRPITLTLSGSGSQTVTVTNLDGFANHNLSIVVPAITETPCCQVIKPRFRLFHRR